MTGGEGMDAAVNAPAGEFTDASSALLPRGGRPAWGPRDRASGMTGHLEGAGLSRLRRGGVHPLTTEPGPALSEAAAVVGAPVVVPARSDLAAPARAGGVVSPLPSGPTAGVPGRPTAAAAASATGEDLHRLVEQAFDGH